MDYVDKFTTYATDMSQVAGELLSELPMYPLFEIMNFILMCHLVREENKVMLPKTIIGLIRPYEERHPLSSYCCSMLLCFSGPILGNILLGKSPIEILANEKIVILASIVWYLMNYCPFDLFHRLICNPLGFAITTSIREVLRLKRLNESLAFGLHFMPGNPIGALLYSHTVASGSVYMRQIQRVLGCRAKFGESPIMSANGKSKVSMLCGALLLAFSKGWLETVATFEQTYAACYTLLICCTALQIFGATGFFEYVESVLLSVFFGGFRVAIFRKTEISQEFPSQKLRPDQEVTESKVEDAAYETVGTLKSMKDNTNADKENKTKDVLNKAFVGSRKVKKNIKDPMKIK